MAEIDLKVGRGRPMKFTDPEELQKRINAYFDLCDPHTEFRIVETDRTKRDGNKIWDKQEVMTEQRPYLISGLARHLETNRVTLFKYRSPSHYPEDMDRAVVDELINSIEGAFARVEEYQEEQLYIGNSNGARFALTNNYKWIEKPNADDKEKPLADLLDEMEDVQDISEQAKKELDPKNGEEGSPAPE